MRNLKVSDLDTPVAIVDMDLLERNIAGLQAYLSRHRIANRPHIKTHKIPEVARMQLGAGAVGITCQKLGEAEVMADAGIQDIFLPYNILGEAKLSRLIKLSERVRMSVTADSAETIQGLAAAAGRRGLTLPVQVEFDTGLGRCGVQTPEEARGLARMIAKASSLRFAGLMTYPHNERTDTFVQEAKALLSEDGLPLDQVSLGCTASMWQAHTRMGVTEYRAGMYIYGDRGTISHGAMRVEECSLRVLTTVVSRPTADRGILDAGSKTLSSDLVGLDGYGMILEYPEAHIARLSEEHGHTDFSRCQRKPKIGERVSVIPNHCCVVNNLFNQIVAVRNDRVEVVWPVAARGAVQ